MTDITPDGIITDDTILTSDATEVEETGTTETEETAPAYNVDPERAFYAADYIRFAQHLKRSRHVKGDRTNPKDAAAQVKIDAVVSALSEIFAADAANPVPGVAGFDAEKFAAGTLL